MRSSPFVPFLKWKEIRSRMRVLVFSPQGPRGLEPEVLKSLVNQRQCPSFDLLVTRDNPFRAMRQASQNIQLNYEKMRQLVLTEGYEKVWIVEADTIPPEDALARLLRVPSPVASGLYAFRHCTPPVPNVARPGVHRHSQGTQFGWEEIQKAWGETIEVSGCGMGCLLIDSKALEGFCFERPEGEDLDCLFNTYCWNQGIKQMADLGVICGHKKPDGEIIWPDRQMGFRLE